MEHRPHCYFCRAWFTMAPVRWTRHTDLMEKCEWQPCSSKPFLECSHGFNISIRDLLRVPPLPFSSGGMGMASPCVCICMLAHPCTSLVLSPLHAPCWPSHTISKLSEPSLTSHATRRFPDPGPAPAPFARPSPRSSYLNGLGNKTLLPLPSFCCVLSLVLLLAAAACHRRVLETHASSLKPTTSPGCGFLFSRLCPARSIVPS